MRLGQIKHILKTVSNDNHHLELEAEPIANGAFYKILNLKRVKIAVNVLAENNLAEAPSEDVENAFNSTSTIDGAVIASAHEYSLMRTYLASINNKLASVIDVLDSLIQDQPENIINIMLPSDVCTFADLESVKSRIVGVFKEFKISDRDIEIVGFDSGSKWYKVIVKDKKFIVTTLFAAMSFAVDLLNYANSLSDNSDVIVQVENMNIVMGEKTGNEKCTISQEEYINSLVEKRASQLVDEFVEKLNEEQMDNDPKKTYANMVKKGLIKMYEERKNGLIFDPSLNPPDFLKSDEGLRYTIDYEKLQKIEDTSAPVKELKTGASDVDDDKK